MNYLFACKKNTAPYPIKGVLFSLLCILIAPLTTQWLVLLPLILQCYRLVHYDEHVLMADFALLIPFITIFMIPNIGSALSLLVVLTAVYYFFKTQYVENRFPIIALVILIIYLFFRITGGLNDYIFVASNLTVMYYMVHKCTPEDAFQISINFILGLLLASFYGHIFRGTPALTRLIAEDSFASRDFMEAYRFRAIFLDSNYYSCSLILAMSLTVVLYMVKKLTQMQSMTILFLFTFFGVATYSRTFFVMFVGLLLVTIYLLFKNKQYFPLFCLCISIFIISFLILNGQIHAFDVVLGRFFKSKNVSDLTSGRTMQFKRYLDYIISSPGQLLFGSGIGANLYGKLGAHNLYLETPYFIGLVGAVLLFSYFQSLRMTLKRKNHIHYSFRLYLIAVLPLVMLMIVYCSLQGLLSTMLYVQFFIAFTAYLLPSLLQQQNHVI